MILRVWQGLRGLFCMIALLSIIPVPRFVQTGHPRHGFWAVPIVGAVIGAFITIMPLFSDYFFPLASHYLAIMVIIGQIIMTRALHYDGFADIIDSGFGAFDAQGREKILKDPHIGSYAVIALIIVLTLEFILWSDLISLVDHFQIIGLVMIPRIMILWGMATMTMKQGGLAGYLGTPTIAQFTIGNILFFIFGFLIFGGGFIFIFLSNGVLFLILRKFILDKFKWCNGDGIGFMIICSQIMTLMVAVNFLG